MSKLNMLTRNGHHIKLRSTKYHHSYDRRGAHFDNSSTDSQFTESEEEEELTFFEACTECDEDALYDIIQDGVTWDVVNERDRSGRTGLSHACGNGFMPIIELLADVEEVDVNLPDNDGNSPLIFASQAGHDDVVNFLLHHFRRIRIDQCNHLGFTALMKAAIQGRTRCAKLLLFAGAHPNRRDYGRGLCAQEWAKFCGRQTCADAISKYLHSKKYFLKKTFFMTREKWSSEPDLASRRSKTMDKAQHNWIQRHLSFKKKRSTCSDMTDSAEDSPTGSGPLGKEARCASSPLLITPDPEESSSSSSASNMRRPSCIDGVVAVNFMSKRAVRAFDRRQNIDCLQEETPQWEPPKILETDFDLEKEKGGVG